MIAFCGKLDFIADCGEIHVLYVISSMTQLNVEQLMEVYLEGNIENGEEFFPDFDLDEQIKNAESSFIDYLHQDFFCHF